MSEHRNLALVTKTFRGKVYRWRPGSDDIAVWHSLNESARPVPDEVISLPDWVVAGRVTPEVFELLVRIYAETHANE